MPLLKQKLAKLAELERLLRQARAARLDARRESPEWYAAKERIDRLLDEHLQLCPHHATHRSTSDGLISEA